MREILFRGIRKDTHELVYGFYGEYFNGKKNISCISVVDTHAIAGAFCYEVIPETVSQFTGLYDKNGVRIWENDIVIIGGNKSFPTVIEFLSGSWQCVRKYTDKGRENEYSYLHRLEYDNPNKYEVIGNRFDNLDLLN